MDEYVLTVVAAALGRAGLDRHDARLLAAVSGGADSVAMLLALCKLRERLGYSLCVAHVEHGLRGEASLADAAFVERLCARLTIPFVCDHASVSSGSGLEARARDARYALLCRRAREQHADALLLAHHLDDQAETVLMNLLRGCGGKGLGGMREQSMQDGVLLLRPLLCLTRQDLLAFLDQQPYRTDGSNSEPFCLRNRLRLEVLPALCREQPRAKEHLVQTAALLAMDEDYLQAQAGELLQTALVREPRCLQLAPLRQAPQAVAIRALRAFAEDAMRLAGAPAGDSSLSAADSLRLLAVARQGGQLNLPCALRADVTERFLHVVRMVDDAPILPISQSPAVVPTNGARVGSLTLAWEPDAVPDGKRAVSIPQALWTRCMLRYPQPGDWIHPFGAPGRKPLRRWLSDQKVDRPFRACQLVLCLGDQVLWAIGVGAAEATRETESSIRLRMTGCIPWLDTALEPPIKE